MIARDSAALEVEGSPFVDVDAAALRGVAAGDHADLGAFALFGLFFGCGSAIDDGEFRAFEHLYDAAIVFLR